MLPWSVPRCPAWHNVALVMKTASLAGWEEAIWSKGYPYILLKGELSMLPGAASDQLVVQVPPNGQADKKHRARQIQIMAVVRFFDHGSVVGSRLAKESLVDVMAVYQHHFLMLAKREPPSKQTQPVRARRFTAGPVVSRRK